MMQLSQSVFVEKHQRQEKAYQPDVGTNGGSRKRHADTVSNTNDIVMRMVLNGSEPMRFKPTSANNAVAVHEGATPNKINSPTNIYRKFAAKIGK